jgi:hypothetical protein
MEDVACGLGEFCKFSRAVEVTYLTPLRIVVSRAPDRLWRLCTSCLHDLRVECEPVWHTGPLTTLAKNADVSQRRKR